MRRGKPVVSDMVYSPRSDCLVVRYEDNDKGFYHGMIVLDLAAGGRMLHGVNDLGCAPRPPAHCALVGMPPFRFHVRYAAQGGPQHRGVHTAGRRLWHRAGDGVCRRR